jgi:hypothetical protein
MPGLSLLKNYLQASHPWNSYEFQMKQAGPVFLAGPVPVTL